MKKRKAYRHGDVILVEVDKIPTKAKEKEGLTLAYGEVTGHSHQVQGGIASMFGYDEKTYLRVTKRATLSHEEHKALSIPEGDFEVIIQHDYEPEGWKKVVD